MGWTKCFVLGTLLLYLIIGCSSSQRKQASKEDPIYRHYEQIEKEEWEAEKELFFTFPIEDTNHPYKIEVELRVRSNCRLKSIHLGFVEETPSLGSQSYIRTIDLTPKLATNGGYNYHEFSLLLFPNRVFTEKGIYSIGVRHLLSVDKLKGVADLGIIVTPML